MTLPEEDAQKQEIIQIIQDYLSGSLSFQSNGGITIPKGSVQSQIFESGTGGSGWRIEDNGNAEFNNGNFRGDITGASGTFSGTISASAGAIGGFNIGADYIRDVANTMGLASTVTGGDDVRFWAGDTFANRATAPFRVTEAGAVTATNFTFTGGSVGSAVVVAIGSLNVAARGWTQTSIFSVTDADTVAWAAGSFISADGTTYSISGGNTGNMAAATYIYLDTAVSTTVYQTTTTAATAVGAGKVLIAKAQNGTGEATFQVFGGIGGQNIDASSIVANSITANELSTSITYAGSIIVDISGLIRSGQTAYNTGTGWFLGNVGGTPKFSIGDGGTSYYLTWDGSTLNVNGSTISNNDIYGDGSDGDVTISVDTTLAADKYYNNLTVNTGKVLNTGGYRIFVKNTLTTVGTGTIKNVGAVGTAGGNAPSSGGGGGSAGSGGAAAAAGFFLSGQAGGNASAGGAAHDSGGYDGHSNAGTDGAAQTNALGATGKTGGRGGSGGIASTSGGNTTGGVSGVGGAGGTATAGSSIPRTSAELILMRDFAQTTPPKFATNGGSGGGSGGGGGGANAGSLGPGGGGGGGTGGSGGIVLICARKIVNAGTISVAGGAGANGGNGGQGTQQVGDHAPGGGGGGGGGSGGNGGIVALIYSSLTNTGTVTVAGGAAGTKGTGGIAGGDSGTTAGVDGVDGTAGATGTIFQLQV